MGACILKHGFQSKTFHGVVLFKDILDAQALLVSSSSAGILDCMSYEADRRTEDVHLHIRHTSAMRQWDMPGCQLCQEFTLTYLFCTLNYSLCSACGQCGDSVSLSGFVIVLGNIA